MINLLRVPSPSPAKPKLSKIGLDSRLLSFESSAAPSTNFSSIFELYPIPTDKESPDELLTLCASTAWPYHWKYLARFVYKYKIEIGWRNSAGLFEWLDLDCSLGWKGLILCFRELNNRPLDLLSRLQGFRPRKNRTCLFRRISRGVLQFLESYFLQKISKKHSKGNIGVTWSLVVYWFWSCTLFQSLQEDSWPWSVVQPQF